jgi:hypothetical protein
MATRKITSFISSSNRQPNESVYSFSVDYPDGVLSCKDNEHIELNVLSFDMPNNMYNINSTNDHFQITLDNANIKDIHLKHGNYSVKTLLKEFQDIFSQNVIPVTSILHTFFGTYADALTIECVYNDTTNTYTFKKDIDLPLGITLPIAFSLYFKPINCGALLGMENDLEHEITANGMNTGLINLIDYNKIIVHTDNISYYYSNIENLSTNSNRQFLSNIIFWKSKADVPPYQIIKYNNEDGGNSFIYKIENREINSLVLQLKNERGEFLKDAVDYMIVIQYIIYERDDGNIFLKSIDNTIKKIFDAIVFAMGRLRLL